MGNVISLGGERKILEHLEMATTSSHPPHTDPLAAASLYIEEDGICDDRLQFLQSSYLVKAKMESS